MFASNRYVSRKRLSLRAIHVAAAAAAAALYHSCKIMKRETVYQEIIIVTLNVYGGLFLLLFFFFFLPTGRKNINFLRNQQVLRALCPVLHSPSSSWL
jgi:hypothetical protein